VPQLGPKSDQWFAVIVYDINLHIGSQPAQKLAQVTFYAGRMRALAADPSPKESSDHVLLSLKVGCAVHVGRHIRGASDAHRRSHALLVRAA
jgi:hypothetical protein